MKLAICNETFRHHDFAGTCAGPAWAMSPSRPLRTLWWKGAIRAGSRWRFLTPSWSRTSWRLKACASYAQPLVLRARHYVRCCRHWEGDWPVFFLNNREK